MNNNKIDKSVILNEIIAWDSIIGEKVNLIACGGAALTLLDVKEFTRDVHFVVPKAQEYHYLLKVLPRAGYKPIKSGGLKREYGFKFEFFKGNTVDATKLVHSPLKEDKHIKLKQFKYIYAGALNFYDLIISKLFKASPADIDDCLELIKLKREEIDVNKLKTHYLETSKLNVSGKDLKKNLESFLRVLGKAKLLKN